MKSRRRGNRTRRKSRKSRRGKNKKFSSYKVSRGGVRL